MTPFVFAAVLTSQASPDTLPVQAYMQTFGGAPYVSPAQTDVRLVTESVRQTFNRGDIAVESRYVFKNDSDKEISLVLRHPVHAWVDQEKEPVHWGLTNFRMTWDNEPVEAVRQGRDYLANVTIRPNATHVARFTYRTGYGSTEYYRFASYGTAGAGSWKGRVERADYSFAYSPATMFGVKEFTPNWNWQWGDNGAYYQRRDYKPAAGEKYTFSFYAP